MDGNAKMWMDESKNALHVVSISLVWSQFSFGEV